MRARVHRPSVRPPAVRDGTARHITRGLLATAYVAAGVLHLAIPQPFLSITPGWVPAAPLIVQLTGVAEVAGAIGLAQPWSPRLRRAAGWGLAAYALCVWPANINHLMMDMARRDRALGWAYHGPRMLLQPVLIWAAMWSSGVLGRGVARRSRSKNRSRQG